MNVSRARFLAAAVLSAVVVHAGGCRPRTGNGIIRTIVGNGVEGYSPGGVPSRSAAISHSIEALVVMNGHLFYADSKTNKVRMVDYRTGRIMNVAGSGATAYSGDGMQAVTANLAHPSGLAVDPYGDLYISEFHGHRVRRVEHMTGVIRTYAGTGAERFNGDGIPAASANISGPASICFDSRGNLYIADFGHSRIRMVDRKTRKISTIAGTGATTYNGEDLPAVKASVPHPYRVAVDAKGNLYVLDTTYRVRIVSRLTGRIRTVAGTGDRGFNGDGIPAVSARLAAPQSFCVDGEGNLYIADTLNGRIRVVGVRTGLIRTLAGTGEAGYSGDGGPAPEALVNYPQGGMYVNDRGDLYFDDAFNFRVRMISGAIQFLRSRAR